VLPRGPAAKVCDVEDGGRQDDGSRFAKLRTADDGTTSRIRLQIECIWATMRRSVGGAMGLAGLACCVGALVAEAHVNPSALPSQKPLGMLRSADYAGPHAYFDAGACSFLPAMGAMNGTEWSVHGVGRVFSDREESAGGVRLRVARDGRALPEGVVVTAHVHTRGCSERGGPGAHWMFDASECAGNGVEDPCYNVVANELHFTGATDHHGVVDSSTVRRFDATRGTTENPVDGAQDARGHSVVLHGPAMSFMACCDLTWVDPGPTCATAEDCECQGAGCRCTRGGKCCVKPGGDCTADSQCCGSPRRRCDESTCCGGAHARCGSDKDCCGDATCTRDRSRCALALGGACDPADPSPHQCVDGSVCHPGRAVCVERSTLDSEDPPVCGARGETCETLGDCCRGRKSAQDASRLRCLLDPRIPIPQRFSDSSDSFLQGTCEWLARCQRAGLHCSESSECCGDSTCALHPDRPPEARVCCLVESGLTCAMPDGPAAVVPGVDECCWPHVCVPHAPNAPRGTCQPGCAQRGEACSTRPCCAGSSCNARGVCV